MYVCMYVSDVYVCMHVWYGSEQSTFANWSFVYG